MEQLKFRTLLNEIWSTLLVSELFSLHRVFNTGLNLLFSEINFLCKVLRTYIVANVLFVKIVSSTSCIHYKLMKLNFTICSVLSLSSWWQQLLRKTYALQRFPVAKWFNGQWPICLRKTKSCRQHALLVLRLTLVTSVSLWLNGEGQIVNDQQ